MIFRLLPLCVSLGLLAACGGPDNGKLAEAEAETDAENAASGKIDCALNGEERFSRVCETNRISGGEREILEIRHPDGGFQRFEIVTDGRGLIAADGFDETRITVVDNGMIEVRAGSNRYRLPARIQPVSSGES